MSGARIIVFTVVFSFEFVLLLNNLGHAQEFDPARRRVEADVEAAAEAALEHIKTLPEPTAVDFDARMNAWKERGLPAFRALKFELGGHAHVAVPWLVDRAAIEKGRDGLFLIVTAMSLMDVSYVALINSVLKKAKEAGDDADRRRRYLRLLAAADQLLGFDPRPSSAGLFGPPDFSVHELWHSAFGVRSPNTELAEYMYVTNPAAALQFYGRFCRAEFDVRHRLVSLQRSVVVWRNRQKFGLNNDDDMKDLAKTLRVFATNEHWWARAYAAALLRDSESVFVGDAIDELRQMLKADDDPIIKRILQ